MNGPLLSEGLVVYIPVEILSVDEFSDESTYKLHFCDGVFEWVSHDNLMAAMKEADNLLPAGCGLNRSVRRDLIKNEIERLHRELEEIG